MSRQPPSKSVYANIPLDPSTTLIRLREILDSKPGSSAVECRFHLVDLKAVPSYTALSYTWGSAKEMKRILIDGSSVSVRGNVWAFLQQMMLDGGRKWRFVWIDALCINQGNERERNHQVKMMRDIYSSAEIVTVWLEEAADDSDLATRYIASLGKESSSPFGDGSSLVVDYSKTTAAIYRDVLRHVFYYNEDLTGPAKQQFKKGLKTSLRLGEIDVMEREPVTAGGILVAVEEYASAVRNRIEKQMVELFRSRESEVQVFLQELIDESAHRSVLSTTVKCKVKESLEQVAGSERQSAMANMERRLRSAPLRDHLEDACEVGIETTMEWVQESRFEVKSEHDKELDSKMETRMVHLLATQIEHRVKANVLSAIDGALETVKVSVAAKIIEERTQIEEYANLGVVSPWMMNA